MADSHLPLRVLLIEHDEVDALIVQGSLLDAGVPLEAVLWRRTLADGLAALDAHPSCVLLDVQLPGADGLDAVRELVHADSEAVIIALGNGHEAGRAALALGAQDYLVKDEISGGLLMRSMRYGIERLRARRAGARLHEVQLSSTEKSRLERGLLPTPLLTSGLVRCDSYYHPGSDLVVLGGDFFDVVETGGRVRAVVGDVMGHGPDEGAIGVHMRVGWRALVLAGIPDHQVLPALAALLAAETGDGSGFVTCCDLSIDGDLGATLRVAGHPPPLLWASGKTTYLDVAVGSPLGVGENGSWPQTRTTLAPDDALILYTDGLLDAYRVAGDSTSLGLDELAAAVDGCLAGDLV
ncbi:MAG: PP2C family protein-serine/threonine phosphatase, partial [Trebonia sp.]